MSQFMSAVATSKYISIVLCLSLVACAPAREFSHVPQDGAKREGQYPRFSDKPQVETAQFTRQESTRLTRQLDQERAVAVAEVMASEQDARQAALTREALQREVEAKLRAIEQGDAP